MLQLIRFLVTSRKAIARLPALVTDPRVPLRLKAGAACLALLVLSPLNILGDIPLLGIVDDAALLALLVGWFVRSAERYVTHPQSGEMVLP